MSDAVTAAVAAGARAILGVVAPWLRPATRAQVCGEEGHREADVTGLGAVQLRYRCRRCGEERTEDRDTAETVREAAAAAPRFVIAHTGRLSGRTQALARLAAALRTKGYTIKQEEGVLLAYGGPELATGGPVHGVYRVNET